MIWGSRQRTRSRWGRTGPMTRGVGALSRAVAVVWRRSLQLRVVAMTLGLSLVVILALGFVLTSQLTNRVLDVKVRAAIEQIERARTTVSGIVNGEETRSLDSSLQLARNTLTSKTDPASGAGLAGAFDAVLMVPGDGPRAASAAGPVDQVPNSLRGFVKAGQAAYQYATVHTEGFSGPALIIGTPTSSQVANLELYLIFPLKNEQATVTLVRGTMATGGLVLLVLLSGIAVLVSRQVVGPVRSASRIAERFAEGHLSERMPVRGEDDMARLAVSFNDMAESLSRQIAQLEEFGNLQRRFTSDVSHELRTPLTTVRMAADLIYDHSDDLDPDAAALDRADGQRAGPVRDAAQRPAGDLPARRRCGRAVGRGGRPAHHGEQRAGQRGPPGRGRRHRAAGGHARRRGDRRGRPAPGRADPAQSDRQRHRPRRAQAGARSGWAPTRTPSPSPCATTGSGCGPARRSWCSAGSGARTRPGCGAPAAPGWAWRSASRTPDCTRAGWRRGASRARAPASG